MRNLLKQIIKFGFVGGTAFFIDAGILLLLTKLGINYLIANILSFSVSVIYNYILSMKFVFNVKETNSQKNFFQFIVLSIIGLGINELIMKICVEKLLISVLIAKIIATIIVMIYNFITRKILLEK